MPPFKIVLLLVVSFVSGCVPTSYVGNFPEGELGFATTYYAGTPPTYFCYPIKNGSYFISVNKHTDSIHLKIKIDGNSKVKFKNGLSKVGKTEKTEEIIHFPNLEYVPNKKLYKSWISLNSSEIDIPKKLGEEFYIMPPAIAVDGALFQPKLIKFKFKKGHYLSPLNT